MENVGEYRPRATFDCNRYRGRYTIHMNSLMVQSVLDLVAGRGMTFTVNLGEHEARNLLSDMQQEEDTTSERGEEVSPVMFSLARRLEKLLERRFVNQPVAGVSGDFGPGDYN